MKHYLMMICLLNVTCISHAMTFKVTLPSKEVLNERFKKAGHEEFAQISKVVSKFANQEMQVLLIPFSYAICLSPYIDYVHENYSKQDAEMLLNRYGMKNSVVYPILLQDFPEALKVLEKNGDYIPAKK